MKRTKRNNRNVKAISGKAANDGWTNFTLGLGASPFVDNQMSDGWFTFNFFTRQRIQLEAAYRTNWLCTALIDCIAQDMTRAGLQFGGEIDPEELTQLHTYWQRAGIMEDLTDAIKWGRLYGGSLALIMTKGTDYTKPLDVSKIGKDGFIGIKNYDRWEIVPDTTALIQESRDIGLPEYYTIVPLNLRIHHSHCLRFIGDKMPHYQAVTEMLWGASVLENVLDRIIAFETVTLGAANLSSRAHLRTIKVDGLRQIFAMGGQAEANLVKQFTYIRQMQNNEGITLLDATDEFETSAYNFSGLDTLILQFVQQISGAKRIPLSILFGEAPAGLNASGDGDIRIYYDSIAAKQMPLDEPVTKLARIVYQSLFGNPAPEDLSIKWNSLWQTNATEKADIATKTTTNIIALHEAGLFDRPMALKELKQSSEITGFGTNITDDDITAEEAPNYTPEPTEEQQAEPQTSRADTLNQIKEKLTTNA